MLSSSEVADKSVTLLKQVYTNIDICVLAAQPIAFPVVPDASICVYIYFYRDPIVTETKLIYL